MIDVDRLLSLVDSMAPPNLPNLPNPQKVELGQPEARNGKASPNLPNLPNLETEGNATSLDADEPDAHAVGEYITSISIKNNLGSLGNLGEPRAAKGYSRPTYPPDNLGSPENLGAPSNRNQDWTCPLGHREFWISDYGLRICATCHLKPEKRRTTP